MAMIPVNSYQGLLDAISSAAAGDTIQITAPEISLNAELPPITKDLNFTSILGSTIRSSGSFRIFTVGSDVSAPTVTFSNLTFTGGVARGAAGTSTNAVGGVGGNGGNAGGGALLVNNGNITLVNMVFQGNRAEGGAGGGGTAGTGGNGGNGLGGALYVRGNSLVRINNTSFERNVAAGGLPGQGSQLGSAGTSQGGAIFVESGTVLAEGRPGYSNNVAAQGPDLAQAPTGSFQELLKPLVGGIVRADGVNDETAALSGTVQYIVDFTQDVTGVDVADFSVVSTGNFTGVVQSVTPIPGNSRQYVVTVAVNPIVGTSGTNGTIRLDLEDNDSILGVGTPPAIVPLGGTGLDNGDFSGQTYTVNRTPPAAVIERKNQAFQLTAQPTVFYTVRFSQIVSNVGADDFQVISNGLTGAQITTVSKINNFTYEVAVSTGSGNGTLNLNLIDNDSIVNTLGVPLGGSGLVNGNVVGPDFIVNKTAPLVAAIERIGNTPTPSATVDFRVSFTQDVSGVDREDFRTAVGGGITGASVLSVTPVDRRTYTVAVNTGSGDGSVGLDLVDDDSIRNDLGVALGGSGNGNGNSIGPVFSVLKSAPLVSSITPASPNPTAAGTVTFSVIFNQDVRNVDRDDFRAFGTGLSNFGIASVSGSGNAYSVVVNTGSGNGSLGLNLIDNDTITNNVNAPLGGRGVGNGNFTGQTFTINKTPPRVVAINRLESSPTNLSTVNYTVTFSEAVRQVDSSDFVLETQGLTGAGIASVTRVNDNFYSVSVNTGRGEGTVRLSLVDNDSIINNLGLPLAGTGAGNGNFRGEAYAIDRTAPVADIIDVAPDPRSAQVDAITLRFNESVRGLDLADLQLTRDGNPVALTNATLTSVDGITWTLGNLQRLTNKRGNYSLLLPASGSGIADFAGNPLANNASDQWTNLVNIEICAPGIRLRGSGGANRLVGTENSDTLLGLAGNDTLIGLDCRDRLDGGEGNDRLLGGEGLDTLLGGNGNDRLEGGLDQDRLNGGAGADRYIYAGPTLAAALQNSLVEAPDRIQGFSAPEGDRFQLDFGGSARSNRPVNLLNAGAVRGSSLVQAARNAVKDSNQAESGAQALRAREAVFFEWRRGTYLLVNDGNARFAADRDLVVNTTGMQFQSGDANRGQLRVADYFA